MKLTKEETLHYTNIAKQQGLTGRKVLKESIDKKVSIAEICRALLLNHSTLHNVLHGVYWSPKILIRASKYLKTKPKLYDWATNLKEDEKTIDNLIINGFSYSEAIQIAQ